MPRAYVLNNRVTGFVLSFILREVIYLRRTGRVFACASEVWDHTR